MQVTFLESELELIGRISMWRIGNAQKINAGGEHFLPGIKRERIGVMGEAVVAKLTGYPWHSMLQPRAYGETIEQKNSIPADVGPYEVRTTEAPHGGLLVNADDAELLPDGNLRPYALVIVGERYGRLVGFQLAGKIKQAKYWCRNLRRPCFRVPQQQLSRQFDTRKWQLVKDLSQKYQLQEQG